MKYKLLLFGKNYLNMIGGFLMGFGMPTWIPGSKPYWWMIWVGLFLLLVSYLSMEYLFKLRRKGKVDFNFKPYTL